MAQEPSEEIFSVDSRFNAKKPHLPQALYVIYQCVGVSPSFNFRVDCSARENLHHMHENFPVYGMQYRSTIIMMSPTNDRE